MHVYVYVHVCENFNFHCSLFIAETQTKRLSYYSKQGVIAVESVSAEGKGEGEVDVKEWGSKRVYHLKVQKEEDRQKLLALAGDGSGSNSSSSGPRAAGAGAEGV